jgi:RNA polymerase sigma-70 factor (ECF subfamily)
VNGGSSEQRSKDRSLWRLVLRRVTRAVHDPAAAEDYLHAAFIRLAEYRIAHEVKNPDAFLVRTAVNLAIDERRRTRVRSDPGLAQILAYDQPIQSEVLLARERLRRVQEGLARLSPRTREVFLMHRLDGLKYREIAAQLGISESAVEKQIAKAALFLTEWMDGW